MRIIGSISGWIWAALLAMLVGFASCGEDDGPTMNSNGQVLAVLYDAEEKVDENSTTTKAPKTTWASGDAIGVFCVEPGKTLGRVNYASNMKYVYDGSKFKPATNQDNIWISRNGNFTFFAYYPYDASKTGMDATAMEFTVSSDQSSESNRTNSDIIAGQSYTADNLTGEVDMIFYHMMADVRFVWTRDDSGSGEYVRALFGPKAIINLDQLTSQAAASQTIGTGIRMNVKNPYDAVSGTTEYQVYVPPTRISHDQEIFVPYDQSDEKLSSIKANIGAAGDTKLLERGNTYDLAGTMYTITADVRRNGDLVPSQCDSYDGCKIVDTGGGDSGNLRKFTGRYLSGRTCKVTANIADGVVAGTQFIGWFEYDRTTNTWSKVPGAGETYTFEVTGNRRLQARYENYVFGNWVMSWTHAGVTKDGSNNFTTTIANTGNTTGLVLVPKATRTVTLDGEDVTDPAFTTREGSQIKLEITSQTPSADMWGVNPWTYDDATKTLKVTPNIDFTDNGTSGAPTERNLKFSVTLLEGGTTYDPATHKYDDMLLSDNGGDMTVVEQKGTMSYTAWTVETSPTNNTDMNANGTTTATVDVYAYRTWSLSGQIVKRESTSSYTNITGAFTSTDSHWTITPGSTGLTKTVTLEGHDFTMRNGRQFTVQAANNETLNARSNTARFTSNSVTKDVDFSQNAGIKTNRTYSNWSISLTASPETLEPYASSGTTNTTLITTSASRQMTFKWNATGDDKTENQTDGGSYNYGDGVTGTLPRVTWTVTPVKVDQFTASGNLTNERVSVKQNYILAQNTDATTATLTATISNTENGSAATTKSLTLTQKGGTYTETFDGWSTPVITFSGNIDGDGGNTSYTTVAPKGTIRAYINGERLAIADYDITAKFSNTTITHNQGATVFSVTNTLDGTVTAEANHGSTTTGTATWSGGSASLSTSSFGRTGGTATISAASYPSRSTWTEYNTSARSETVTVAFVRPDSHTSADYVPAPPSASKTVTQNGSSTELPNTRTTETDTEFTCSENQSWSSVSGKTLSVDGSSSTYSNATSVSAGSLSISPSNVGASGGSVTATASKGTGYYDVYYSSVNRSGTVTIKFSKSQLQRTVGYTQKSSSEWKDSGSEEVTASITWPNWAPGGNVSENTTTSQRSGTVTATYKYGGYSDTSTKTLTQNAGTITYSYKITSASLNSLTWGYKDTEGKTVTVSSGTVKKYKSVNGGTETYVGDVTGCTFSVSGVSVSGSFSASGTSVKPSGENKTSSNKTGTISATVTASKSGITISGSVKATGSATQEYKMFIVQ